MEHGLIARIADRAAANARVIRGAPEAVAFVGIITLGVSYFASSHIAVEDRETDSRLKRVWFWLHSGSFVSQLRGWSVSRSASQPPPE
jgi:hypothetical protein